VGAQQAFESAVSADDSLFLAHARLGELFVLNGDHVRAQKSYESAVLLIPKSILVPGAAARAEATNDENTLNVILAAGQTYRLLGAFYMDTEESTNFFTRLFGAESNVQKAVSAWKQAAAINPADPTPLVRLGMHFYETGQYDLAITWLMRSLEFVPHQMMTAKEAEALATIGDAYYFKGNHTESVSWFKQSLEVEPDAAHVWESLGNALNRLRMKMMSKDGVSFQRSDVTEESVVVYMQAHNCWKRAIELDSTDRVDCYINLGQFYELQHEPKRAKRSYQAALASECDVYNAQASFAMAKTCLRNLEARGGGDN
jgi:tetratricopeptide (TPR) repeat protein